MEWIIVGGGCLVLYISYRLLPMSKSCLHDWDWEIERSDGASVIFSGVCVKCAKHKRRLAEASSTKGLEIIDNGRTIINRYPINYPVAWTTLSNTELNRKEEVRLIRQAHKEIEQ